MGAHRRADELPRADPPAVRGLYPGPGSPGGLAAQKGARRGAGVDAAHERRAASLRHGGPDRCIARRGTGGGRPSLHRPGAAHCAATFRAMGGRARRRAPAGVASDGGGGHGVDRRGHPRQRGGARSGAGEEAAGSRSPSLVERPLRDGRGASRPRRAADNRSGQRGRTRRGPGRPVRGRGRPRPYRQHPQARARRARVPRR